MLAFAVFGGDPDTPRGYDLQDSALLVAVRTGDREVFETLVRKYYDSLYRFACMQLRSTDGAEDVVQEVLWRVWEHRERLSVHTSIRAYLYRALRNIILDQRRHEQIVDGHIGEALRTETAPPHEQPDVQYDLNELRAALVTALAQLPERAREAYLLYHQGGLSYVEIAEAMEISVKGVEFHMGKALKLLRLALSRFAPS